MIIVLKSIVNSSEDCSSILNSYSQNKEYFSFQEKAAFDYIIDIHKENGEYPTEKVLINHLPDLKLAIEQADIFKGKDLDVYYKTQLTDRKKKHTSRLLLEEINTVSVEGFTATKFDRVRSIYHSQQVVDPTVIRPGITDYSQLYYERKNRPLGMLSNVEAIDNKIGGFSYGTVNLIFGWVGHFKSMFGLNVAYNNVINNNYNVVFISLEVSREEIMFNLLSRHSVEDNFTEFSSIPHKKIKDGTLSPEEEEYLFQVVGPDLEERTKNKFFILDESDFSSLSFDEIYMKLDAVDNLTEGLDAVFWDHINLFKFGGSSKSNPYERINEYIAWIRSLSVDFKKKEGKSQQLINVVLMQANRDGWDYASKHNGKYSLTSMAEANEAERSAYRIISVYTDQSLKNSNLAQVQLLKNRSGETFDEPIQVYANGRDYVFGDQSIQGFDKSPFNQYDSRSDLEDFDGLGDFSL